MTITEIITIAVSAALSVLVGGLLRHVSRGFRSIREDFQTLKEAQRDSLRYQTVQAHDTFVTAGVPMALCFAAGADLFAVLGLDFGQWWIGTALTGLFASRDANFVSDLVKRLRGMGQAE